MSIKIPSLIVTLTGGMRWKYYSIMHVVWMSIKKSLLAALWGLLRRKKFELSFAKNWIAEQFSFFYRKYRKFTGMISAYIHCGFPFDESIFKYRQIALFFRCCNYDTRRKFFL